MSAGRADGCNMAQQDSYSMALRVRDLPSRLRPREQMDAIGAEHVADDVLLAVLLRSGVRGASVVDLARRLLNRYGSLTALSRVSLDELSGIHGMGRVKAQVVKAALELGRRLAAEQMADAPTVRTPADVAAVLRERARALEVEAFWVLLLDVRNRLRRPPYEVSRGLLDASLVHPREVFKEAIRSVSAAVLIAHNHPSGDPSPSAEDIRITRQMVEAGRVVDIPVLDHVIIGRPGAANEFFSLRESGLVQFSS
jgi:DNA repair protein RadC